MVFSKHSKTLNDKYTKQVNLVTFQSICHNSCKSIVFLTFYKKRKLYHTIMTSRGINFSNKYHRSDKSNSFKYNRHLNITIKERKLKYNFRSKTNNIWKDLKQHLLGFYFKCLYSYSVQLHVMFLTTRYCTWCNIMTS